MARLAVFLDGGYLDRIAEDEFTMRVDYRKLIVEMQSQVAAKTPEALDLLRTYYYHCLPYQSNPPTQDEARRYGQARQFWDALRFIDRFQIREGRLARLGLDANGHPIFQQKKVDLLLGLDFALLSGTKQITHAAVLSGDSDLIPAFEVARPLGISLWLFHGPRKSRKDGRPTFAQELWLGADERVEIDQAFMTRIKR